MSFSDVSNNRFTGVVPSLDFSGGRTLNLQGNFFHTYSPFFASNVCNFKGDLKDRLFIGSNCLPEQPLSPYCNQTQRSADVCSATCSSNCPGSDACYVVESDVQACPCDAAQYASTLNPGKCFALDGKCFSGAFAVVL